MCYKIRFQWHENDVETKHPPVQKKQWNIMFIYVSYYQKKQNKEKLCSNIFTTATQMQWQ
jgi:hypothetical protein